MDKISIITATFNCVNDLEMTLQSVFEQDYPNIEYIIIDGASTDGTVDLIKKYSSRLSYWISEPDRGLYYAMNKGIDVASGDWIYILNSGGKFPSKNTLSDFFALNHSNEDAVFGYIYSTLKGDYIRNPKPFYEYTNNRYRKPGFSHQSIFIRTKWLKETPFDTNFKCCADFNQLVTIYNKGAKFKYVDILVSISAKPGFSANHRKLQRKETAIINGVEQSLWFRINEVKIEIKEFIKKIMRK